MPTVPRLSDERLRTSPLPSARQTVNATEETFGGGQSAARTSAATNELIATGQRIALKAKEQADELSVLNGSAQLSTKENALLHDPKNGAFSKRGQDVFGLPEQVLGDYDKAAKEIESTLGNDQQKLEFKKQWLGRRISIDQSLQKHVAAQIEQYDSDTTKSFIENERQAASLNYHDLNRVSLSLARQAATLQAQQQRQGLPKEWLEQNLNEATSKTHRDIIERMLAVGDPNAYEYADRVKSKLTSEDIALVEKAKTEAKQLQKEQQDELERATVLGAVDGRVTPESLRTMLAAKQIDVAFYDKMTKRLFDVNDLDTIPADQKTARLFEVSRMFAKLDAPGFGGAAIDKKTKERFLLPKEEAKGNRLERLKAFRAFVAESAPYLTKEQEKAFYLYTQKNWDAAASTKAGLFSAFTEKLALLFGQAPTAASFLKKGLDQFNPKVEVGVADETFSRLKSESEIAANPRRSRYTLNQIVTNTNGASAKVIGFDSKGDPQYEWIRK
jgi:hypothetical protein